MYQVGAAPVKKKLKLSSSWERCLWGNIWELLNPYGTHILHIYWIYNDAIDLIYPH